ncbi:hypothetical protein Pse7429DRAFT_4323, partial [Pseudanabaena biceps PCC 7429]
AAHAQRAPQVLDLDFNYAEVLTTHCAQTQTNEIFESVALQRFQKFHCGSFDR